MLRPDAVATGLAALALLASVGCDTPTNRSDALNDAALEPHDADASRPDTNVDSAADVRADESSDLSDDGGGGEVSTPACVGPLEVAAAEDGEHMILPGGHGYFAQTGGDFVLLSLGTGSGELSAMSYPLIDPFALPPDDGFGAMFEVHKECGTFGCGRVFVATAGAIRITSYQPGGRLAGEIRNAVMVEATQDPTSGRYLPADDGQTLCLAVYSFDVPALIANPVAEQEPSPSCVAEGNGKLVGHNVANAELSNCYGDPVGIHDSCGQAKALWLFGTTGWCSACEARLAELVAEHGGALSRANVAQQRPGLDMLIVLGETQYGAAPSLAYCLEYAQSKNIDPAMVLIDYAQPAVDIPAIEPAGSTLPIHAFGSVWSVMDPYFHVPASGVAPYGVPWTAVLRGSNMEYLWFDNFGSGDPQAMIDELVAP